MQKLCVSVCLSGMGQWHLNTTNCDYFSPGRWRFRLVWLKFCFELKISEDFFLFPYCPIMFKIFQFKLFFLKNVSLFFIDIEYNIIKGKIGFKLPLSWVWQKKTLLNSKCLVHHLIRHGVLGSTTRKVCRLKKIKS